MELNFDRSNIFCLNTAMEDIQNIEQTQQIQLPEGMPDVGEILAAWGQPILRGKEWRGDSVSFSGGMMVWVLYAPEDGSGERCIDTWIPFQMRWDLPDGTPEGNIHMGCIARFADARPVSARKIQIRAGMGALACALVPYTAEVSLPSQCPDRVELLESTYPLRLMKEAGEKSFTQDEALTLPDSAPLPGKLIYYNIQPRLSDKKVLSGKLVFRGNTNLHILYQSEEGRLQSWDFEVPFSQYAELTGEHSTDAQAEFLLSPTGIELELGDEGDLRFKCGITAQYLITDKQPVVLVEDAYCPDRDLQLQKQLLELPVVLESRREKRICEQSMAGDGGTPVDFRFHMDYPRQIPGEGCVEVELHGQCQLLYYGEDGRLHSSTSRWEDSYTMAVDENTRVRALPLAGEVHAHPGGGQVQLRGDMEMELLSTARQGIASVVAVAAGEPRQPDPGRPSLILRRAGESRLWDLAKASGSTVEAIRKANALTGEPAPGQLLLIPVP